MRVSDKPLKEYIIELIGNDAFVIVKLLKGRDEISELSLSKKIKADINEVRNLLYRLYDKNLVSFKKKKDKKKGWYVYYWSFNNKMLKDAICNLKKEKITNLKNHLNKEVNGNFFVCENRCIRLGFDNVMESGFKCPECGALMNQDDNQEKIKRIKDKIKSIENSIKV